MFGINIIYLIIIKLKQNIITIFIFYRYIVFDKKYIKNKKICLKKVFWDINNHGRILKLWGINYEYGYNGNLYC